MSDISPNAVILSIILILHQIGWNYFALRNRRIVDLIISAGLRHNLMTFLAALLMINLLWPLKIIRRDVL